MRAFARDPFQQLTLLGRLFESCNLISKAPAAATPRYRRAIAGSPLQHSRVAVVEVTYLTWTEDNLLRQASYQGQREDKPAAGGKVDPSRSIVRAVHRC